MKIDGKICGAVFRNSEAEAGISYTGNEGVVEIKLQSDINSSSSYTYAL